MKNFLSIKLHTFLVITSLLIFVYLLGFDFIKINNQEWFNSGDISTYQLGWKYFREDIWRFPIGLNPNYGIYLNGSVFFQTQFHFLLYFLKYLKIFYQQIFNIFPYGYLYVYIYNYFFHLRLFII